VNIDTGQFNRNGEVYGPHPQSSEVSSKKVDALK